MASQRLPGPVPYFSPAVERVPGSARSADQVMPTLSAYLHASPYDTPVSWPPSADTIAAIQADIRQSYAQLEDTFGAEDLRGLVTERVKEVLKDLRHKYEAARSAAQA